MAARDVLYQSPSELDSGEGTVPPPQSEPQSVAAGLPAVLSTLAFTARGPGLLRGGRGLLKLNQEHGVDCPSCAWPDPEQRGLFEFCENGAKALADETTTRRLEPEVFARHSVQQLSRLSDFKLNNLGRITTPMHLAEDESHYRPISWSDAFALIAGQLKALPSPQQAAFYTSGRCSNEAAFLYGTMVRMLGSNNLPDCSNMCHESSGIALASTIGIGKGTVTLEDFSRTDLILVMGQNPGTNHPRMLSALEGARKGGARIVSINPLAETGLARFKNPQDFLNPAAALGTALGSGNPLADMHLPVRIGGDLALLKGIGKTLLEWFDEGRPTLDLAFIEARTEGFQSLAADLRAQPWDELVASAGVSREQIRDLAAWAAGTQRIIVCWAMGITQHLHSVATIGQIVNLLLMRGAIGRPGAGACPVRGHSNVQGDRTVGITTRPRPDFLQRLGREFGFEPPAQPGLDTVETIEAMLQERVKVLVALGGNFLSATPDTARVAQALQRCRLTVAVATKLNRSHLVTGAQALLLPCLGRTEIDAQASGPQFVSCENSMGKVQRSVGFLPPASPHLLSEVAIVTGMAQALELPQAAGWARLRDDYDGIRASIERVVPGFDSYAHRIRQRGGFSLPNGPREGVFPTPSGKARFTVADVPGQKSRPDELDLMTIRSHDQFNTTVYGYADRYRGIKSSRRVVFANPGDLQRLGLRPGQKVDIVSLYDGLERRVDGFTLVAYPIPSGCAAAYFPEANPLVPASHRDPQSGCPASKKVAVRLLAQRAP
jgi:molybdopterin-dependent oxidoreductase alpha subunit